MNRHHLHEMLDLVPESHLPKVLNLLRSITDPVQLALEDAPYDDEPLTDDERARLQESLADLAAGRVISFEDAMVQLGIDPDSP